MINTNQSKLTPTLDRNTDKGGTMTWEQCKYPKKTQIISNLRTVIKLRLNEKPLKFCVNV